MTKTPALAALTAVAALAAAPAHAGSPPSEAQPGQAAAKAELDAAVFAPRYDDAPVRIPGVARTSLDYGDPDGVSAALGFLCGLKPGADRTGAAAARGYDPTGRFVGARFSIAFR